MTNTLKIRLLLRFGRLSTNWRIGFVRLNGTIGNVSLNVA